MYVLVKDNFVFYGPNIWSPNLMSSYIEDDFEIQLEIPKEPVISGSNLGHDIFVYKIEKQEIPEFNSKIERLEGPFYKFIDVPTQYFTVAEKDIDLVKSELLKIVEHNRWEYEVSGITVTIQGVDLQISTKRGERDIFSQALSIGNETSWKLKDVNNNIIWLALSIADLSTITSAITSHVSESFNLEKSKSDEILAASDLDTLDKIDLTISS